MQETSSRAPLALVLAVERGPYYRSRGDVVLLAQVGDVGLEGVEVADAGVVDEVVDSLEGEGEGDRHFFRLFVCV